MNVLDNGSGGGARGQPTRRRTQLVLQLLDGHSATGDGAKCVLCRHLLSGETALDEIVDMTVQNVHVAVHIKMHLAEGLEILGSHYFN